MLLVDIRYPDCAAPIRNSAIANIAIDRYVYGLKLDASDNLLARKHVTQVGILKRLRGTPIVRHDDEYRMIYAPHPPYEILSTRDISFEQMQRMRRFARYWDIIANSGHFTATLKLLWRDEASPFAEFLRFSDWLHATLRRTHQIALHVIAQALFDYLTEEKGVDHELAASTLEADWHRTPSREALNLRGRKDTQKSAALRAARRQSRHTQTV